MEKEHPYIDVEIRPNLPTSEIAGLLSSLGLLGSWEDEHGSHLYWEQSAWRTEMLDQVYQTVQLFNHTSTPYSITVNELPWEDWNAEWTRKIEPIHIGKRIIIRPSWKSCPIPSNGIELIIDPKQAFGTGHHPTTQLLIRWLEDHIQGNETVLDIGTGSGILAMVALRLGASYALGIDHDPIAIQYAGEYAQHNQFASSLVLKTSTLEQLAPQPFDIILANLDYLTLTSIHHLFQRFQEPTTTLLLSGLLKENEEEITRLFLEKGWMVEATTIQGQWIAIHLQSE